MGGQDSTLEEPLHYTYRRALSEALKRIPINKNILNKVVYFLKQLLREKNK